jgi:hypothetical protein
MHFENDRLVIDRERSNLDDLVLEFLSVLEAQDVEYVVVAGYVAILTGRSRATEDVDLIIEQLSADETEQLATALSDAGYWWIEEDLERMYDRRYRHARRERRGDHPEFRGGVPAGPIRPNRAQ